MGAIAQAQIVPDNTLPNNSVVVPNGEAIEITEGTTAGSNLFHSFEQFSVLNEQTAVFDNATAIENIISRVTGSSISDLQGLIKANGTANLFLINPNGIVFGENAALDIGGSFVSTTADSLKFADDSEFSAVNPESPLLTVSIPKGLQFGSNNGDITVEGNGHNAFFDEATFTVNRFDRNLGLEVATGNTIALVGKNIFLSGGNLTAEAGNIELGSIAEAGEVGLTANENQPGFILNYGELAGAEISFTDAASIDVSGNGSGNIQIQGDVVNLTDGSAIFAETEGNAAGGLTKIKANRVSFSGTDLDEFMASSIWSDVYFELTEDGDNIKLTEDGDFVKATGNGGSVEIETDSLLVENGAQINVNTFGFGDAGNLTVKKAKDIKVSGESELGFFFSGLYAQADIFKTGDGGNIDIDTDTLLVDGGAQINTSTFGDGDAGDLTVNAKQIELTGYLSGLAVNANGDLGSGGNLTLTTDTLLVEDGAFVSASTFGNGDGGNINIVATEQLQINNDAYIFTDTGGSKNGGSLTLDAKQLQVMNGGQIAVTTIGSGNGGSLKITADRIELDGASDLGSSGIFSSAIESEGNGGSINLDSDRLSITNGATINAGNFPSSSNSEFLPGTGETGSININVNSLELDSASAEKFSSITASANAKAGGDITLDVAGKTEINNYSQITAETQGKGQGGSINFTADRLELSNQGTISVNSSGTGNAGDITIAANLFNLDRGQVTATATEAGGGDITLNTDSLFLDNSSISTSVLESDGGGGNIAIDNTDSIVGKNNSQIQADAVFGDGGQIAIDTTALFFDGSSTITASSDFGLDGVVEINDIESEKKLSTLQLTGKVEPPQAIVTSNCPVSKDNTFAITGKGGMAHNPGQYLRGETVWRDLRIPTISSSNTNSRHDTNATPIEAQTWQINQSGKVELLAKTAISDRLGHEDRCSAMAID